MDPTLSALPLFNLSFFFLPVQNLWSLQYLRHTHKDQLTPENTFYLWIRLEPPGRLEAACCFWGNIIFQYGEHGPLLGPVLSGSVTFLKDSNRRDHIWSLTYGTSASLSTSATAIRNLLKKAVGALILIDRAWTVGIMASKADSEDDRPVTDKGVAHGSLFTVMILAVKKAIAELSGLVLPHKPLYSMRVLGVVANGYAIQGMCGCSYLYWHRFRLAAPRFDALQ